MARSTTAVSSNASAAAAASSTLFRALSTTTESLKVKSTTPPPVANQEERIKYFKIYRWDPDHRQKPVSRNNIDFIMSFLFERFDIPIFPININTHTLFLTRYFLHNFSLSTSQPTP